VAPVARLAQELGAAAWADRRGRAALTVLVLVAGQSRAA